MEEEIIIEKLNDEDIDDLSPIEPIGNKNIIRSKVKSVIDYNVIKKELQEIKDLNFYKTKKYALLSNIDNSIKINQKELDDKYKKLIVSIKKNYLETYLQIRFGIDDLDLELRHKTFTSTLNKSKELMDHESAKKITKNMLNDQIQHEKTILFTEYKYYFELLKNL
jgi:hypothetical protein